MLYMVVERFKDVAAIGERFERRGRMQPEGLTYHASWLDFEGTRCFQLMEAENPELLNLWMSRWNDLMEFAVTPVLTSREFWARR